MQCAAHPTEAATAICTRCDKLLCTACGRDYRGKTFCSDCADFLGRREQRQTPVSALPAPDVGPAEVYGGPPAAPHQSAPPSAAPESPDANPHAPVPPATAPSPPAANPYQSAAPGVTPKPPAANPYQSAAPGVTPKPPPANPYQSAAPGVAPKPAAANPYQSAAPGVVPKPAAANPYQSAAPGVASPSPVASQGDLYQGPPPAGDVYQGPPAGDLYQGPPPGDVYQGPPPGDVHQGSPGDVYQGSPGDVYQGAPPPDGVYQGPPADGVYQGSPTAGAAVSVTGDADDEGSLGKALVSSAIAGLVGVLVSWGISAATGKVLKLSSLWIALGPMIGRSAVEGAGRGGGDVALVSAGVTIVALFCAEIIVGYQRGYIEVGLFDWIFWGIGGYWAYRIPAERA